MPPDRWLVLTAHALTDDPLRDRVAEGLIVLGGLSVLEEPDSLTTYLAPPADPEARVREAARFLRDWLAADPPPLSWRWQAHEDWESAWRRGLQPRKVSPRLVVKPSWTHWDASPGELVLVIDPQMAFGTGEHATTRGCLRLLDALIRPGDRALDLGSGSGVLAIAAALLGASEVIAVEYDPDANLNARENFARNRVASRIHLREQMADPALIPTLGTFDLILANILSGVIRPLLPSLARALNPGGRLILSGVLERERDALIPDAQAAGVSLEREDSEEEWWTTSWIVVG